jgi:hypothetical protein
MNEPIHHPADRQGSYTFPGWSQKPHLGLRAGDLANRLPWTTTSVMIKRSFDRPRSKPGCVANV